MLEIGLTEILNLQRAMLPGGTKKGRVPKKTAAGSWKRKGGQWVSLASIAEDAATGTAAAEVGDIIVPDASERSGAR